MARGGGLGAMGMVMIRAGQIKRQGRNHDPVHTQIRNL